MRGFQDRQVVCWRCSTSATSRSRPSIPQHQLLTQGAQGVRLPRARLAEDQHVLAAVEERPVAQAPHLLHHEFRHPRPLEALPRLRRRQPRSFGQASDPALRSRFDLPRRQGFQIEKAPGDTARKKPGCPASSVNGSAAHGIAKTPSAAGSSPVELARAVKALVGQHGADAIEQMVDVFAE